MTAVWLNNSSLPLYKSKSIKNERKKRRKTNRTMVTYMIDDSFNNQNFSMLFYALRLKVEAV